MKSLMLTAAALTLSMSGIAIADADGDAEAGEKVFKKCRACHAIKNGDEVIQKGGKTGPNLYGVIGRVIGGEDFKYGSSLASIAESEQVWDEEQLAIYVANPSSWLKEITDDSGAKSKMTFKLKKGGEDVAAYLASVGPEMEDDDDDDSEEESTESDDS
ncbi:MAG: cytochrome C [Marinosulfonomonas sp.]|nr:MAG: cytochrome C [Marinosulfonomonas sp.]